MRWMAVVLLTLLLITSPAWPAEPEPRLGDLEDEALFLGSAPCQDEETGKTYVCMIFLGFRSGRSVVYRVLLDSRGIYKILRQIGDGKPELIYQESCPEPCA